MFSESAASVYAISVMDSSCSLCNIVGASQWRSQTSSSWLRTSCALAHDWLPGWGGVNREVSMGGSPAPCVRVPVLIPHRVQQQYCH